MARYHFNTDSLAPEICEELVSCEHGDINDEHWDSEKACLEANQHRLPIVMGEVDLDSMILRALRRKTRTPDVSDSPWIRDFERLEREEGEEARPVNPYRSRRDPYEYEARWSPSVKMEHLL